MTTQSVSNHALPISIEALLQGRVAGWDRVVFERKWNPATVLRTMCAFANDFRNLGGGYIVVGVETEGGRPKLPPVGVDPSRLEVIQEEILKLGDAAIQPHYRPRISVTEIQGKSVLVIWTPAGETRPYRAKASPADSSDVWHHYIRTQSRTVVARGKYLSELFGLAATVPFDDRPNREATLNDLSRHLIVDFLREVDSTLAEQAGELSIEQLGRQMNIVAGPVDPDGPPRPKNIGLMMFNEHPEKFFPVSQIDVVYFPNGPGGDRFEEKEFRGPIPRILRDALNHIQRNYLIETVIKHEDRAKATRVWNFPYRAIQEIVTNAVCHRSYEIREPVEVRITADELCVVSFPGPDKSIRVKDIMAGTAKNHRYRNRRIVGYLQELDLVGGRSAGIEVIMQAVRRNGSPLPSFETDDDRSYFVVRLPAHPEAATVRGAADLCVKGRGGSVESGISELPH